jgi:hypothetical protein
MKIPITEFILISIYYKFVKEWDENGYKLGSACWQRKISEYAIEYIFDFVCDI